MTEHPFVVLFIVFMMLSEETIYQIFLKKRIPISALGVIILFVPIWILHKIKPPANKIKRIREVIIKTKNLKRVYSILYVAFFVALFIVIFMKGIFAVDSHHQQYK